MPGLTTHLHRVCPHPARQPLALRTCRHPPPHPVTITVADFNQWRHTWVQSHSHRPNLVLRCTTPVCDRSFASRRVVYANSRQAVWRLPRKAQSTRQGGCIPLRCCIHSSHTTLHQAFTSTSRVQRESLLCVTPISTLRHLRNPRSKCRFRTSPFSSPILVQKSKSVVLLRGFWRMAILLLAR